MAVESAGSLVALALRLAPAIVLAVLAVFFGRTLRAGAVPLIERVARVGKPDLSPALCGYTRGLTALWSLYFLGASLLAAAGVLGFQEASLGVAAVSALFFVGEFALRRLLFPGEWFPGLVQQVLDTVSVWRPRRGT